jgi:hypothetical protein
MSGGFPVACRDRVSKTVVSRDRLKSCSNTNFAALALRHPSSLLLLLRFWEGRYDRRDRSSARKGRTYWRFAQFSSCACVQLIKNVILAIDIGGRSGLRPL